MSTSWIRDGKSDPLGTLRFLEERTFILMCEISELIDRRSGCRLTRDGA